MTKKKNQMDSTQCINVKIFIRVKKAASERHGRYFSVMYPSHVFVSLML